MIRATVLLLLALAVASIQGFSCQAPSSRTTSSNTQLQAVSRSQFLSTAAATVTAATLFPMTAANAKDIDPALKGTKADPAYQTCISTCLYECTKPKGEETKMRQECIPECKVKCATTKQQLMIGTPLSAN